MSEVDVSEENIRKALHKRAKEKKEAKEKHEKANAGEQQPKQSTRERLRDEANRRAAERDDDDDDNGSDRDSSEKKNKKKEGNKDANGSSIVKIVCLCVLVPVVVCIPFVLTRICAFLEQMPKFVLPGIWCVYGLIVVGILFLKRHKITLDSVITHQAIYVIFSLGAYHFMHVADNVPMKYRKDALYVWNTITMLLNIFMMVIDDTDHQKQEREEKEKERRKEERRKRREEAAAAEGSEQKKDKKKKKSWYNKNKYVKIAMDLLVYVAMGVALFFVIRWFMNYKQDFEQRVKEGRAPGDERTWGYESNTGANWKPEVHEEDLKDAEVGGSKPSDDEEWHPEIRDEDLE